MVRVARRTVARARHRPGERPRRDGAARVASLRRRRTTSSEALSACRRPDRCSARPRGDRLGRRLAAASRTIEVNVIETRLCFVCCSCN
eukprot:scaffold109555_cov84-Phaeocystis_antarctica.AAC.1